MKLVLLISLSTLTIHRNQPLIHRVAAEERVTWTPNRDVDPNNRAHTAPRSQKYWDEHGIERPEYAKNDYEVDAERRAREGDGDSVFIQNLFLSFLLAAVPWIGYTAFMNRADLTRMLCNITGKRGGGHRLGDFRPLGQPASSGSSSRVSDEARSARLARFDATKTD